MKMPDRESTSSLDFIRARVVEDWRLGGRAADELAVQREDAEDHAVGKMQGHVAHLDATSDRTPGRHVRSDGGKREQTDDRGFAHEHVRRKARARLRGVAELRGARRRGRG